MGDSHPGHPDSPWQCCGGQLFEYSDGAEQPEESGEGGEGAAAEGAVSVNGTGRRCMGDF